MAPMNFGVNFSFPYGAQPCCGQNRPSPAPAGPRPSRRLNTPRIRESWHAWRRLTARTWQLTYGLSTAAATDRSVTAASPAPRWVQRWGISPSSPPQNPSKLAAELFSSAAFFYDAVQYRRDSPLLAARTHNTQAQLCCGEDGHGSKSEGGAHQRRGARTCRPEKTCEQHQQRHKDDQN